MQRFVDEALRPCFAQVIQGLEQRGTGDADEMGEIVRAETAEALGDVARRRTRRLSNLISQVPITGNATRRGPFEYPIPQLRAELPRIDVLEPPESGHVARKARSLPAENASETRCGHHDR
jgi:hypothetical protein